MVNNWAPVAPIPESPGARLVSSAIHASPNPR
jgi:hypothetical protein